MIHLYYAPNSGNTESIYFWVAELTFFNFLLFREKVTDPEAVLPGHFQEATLCPQPHHLTSVPCSNISQGCHGIKLNELIFAKGLGQLPSL